MGDSLNVLIQSPGLTDAELRAFEKGFKKHSYFENETPAPIPVWIFNFLNPHRPVECNFNARIVRLEHIKSYLDTSAEVKNAIHVFLLDGQLLKAMQIAGLDPEAVILFHQTIRRQLDTEYSQLDFDRYLSGLYDFEVQKLFSIGKVFDHKKVASGKALC